MSRILTLSNIDDFSKLLKIKGYSHNTITSYSSHLRLYAIAFNIEDWKMHTNRQPCDSKCSINLQPRDGLVKDKSIIRFTVFLGIANGLFLAIGGRPFNPSIP